MLFLVLVCWLVLWYALVCVGFFLNLNIRFFADALMFGTGLFLLLSCWFLLCSLLVLFVGWSVVFFYFIDYSCCMFRLFYCLSSVLCWIVVVALIGVLVSWLVRWLVRCFFQTTILITVVFCFWLLSMLYLVFFLVWCFDLILFYWTI